MLTILPRALRPASTRLAKAWQRKNSDLQIDVHHVVPVGLGEIDRIGAPDDAGIVDQPVDRPGLVPDVVEHRLRGGVIGKIAVARPRTAPPTAAIFACRLVHRRAADADHRAAGLRDRHGDALADAGVGAGDEDALAVEAEGGKVAHRSSSIGTGSTSV